MSTTTKGWLVAAATVLLNIPLAGLTVDFTKLDAELRSVIESPKSTDEELLQAISHLGRISEKPEFWKRIVDDPKYETSHRQRAIFALFRRHGAGCMSVRQLAGTIGPAKWLHDIKISKIRHITGAIPIDLNLGESAFSFSVLGGPSVYLRLLGEVTEEDLAQLLNGNARQEVRDGVILQLGFGDDYAQWLTAPARRRVPNNASLSTGMKNDPS